MTAREKEIRDCLEHLPPWPWEVDGRRIVSKRPDRATNTTVAEVYGLSVVKAFVANAPADIHWLLDQLESARSEERKRTREAVEVLKEFAEYADLFRDDISGLEDVTVSLEECRRARDVLRSLPISE